MESDFWKELKERYFRDASVTSLILVGCRGKDADLEFCLRSGEGWRTACKGGAFIGRNGIGKEREGDAKTPVGDFPVVTAFGIKPDPGTVLPYIDIREGVIACDSDCAWYNRIVKIDDLSCVPEGVSGERMSELAPEYNYGIALDFNHDCIYPLGSAIFFHCKGEKSWTGGCVAADEDVVLRVLRECGPAPVFCIHKI